MIRKLTFSSIRVNAEAIGIILFLCLSSNICATPLPAPATLAECTNFGLVDDPTSCTLGGRDALATGSLTLTPFVSLTAQASAGPINDLFDPGAGVFVSVRYSFQVIGGNAGDMVPILIATSLNSTATSSHAS